jgi:hypothetical protein
MNIKRTIASIEELHGSPRDQAAKYDSFIAWQLRQRMKASGREPSPVLRQVADDPHDEVTNV